MNPMAIAIEAAERGLVPDALLRLAIRRLCGRRLGEARSTNDRTSRDGSFADSMISGPIAPAPAAANQQHYELPAEFFAAVLGPRLKYSCCYWDEASTTLEQAEDAALEVTCARAQIADGQDILELGCGWGSLTLWIAERYTGARVTAVSNSAAQRRNIEAAAQRRGIENVRVITADMNDFEPAVAQPGSHTFDRVVSVEMFEHMRNYQALLARIASWLRPGGKLFVHHFCHDQLAYPFETNGSANWMGRHFFTGGIMPSADLLGRFNDDLGVVGRWTWNGQHYRRTAEAWLANLDAHRGDVLRVFERVDSRAEARRWLNRWRMFFLAVAELFGYRGGEEWYVSHCLMAPQAAGEPCPH